MALPCPFTAAAGCGATNSFRGPPLPLVLVPLVIQLVRASRDPKLTAYLTRLVSQGSDGGPAASIAANAHILAQYALSKVPAKVLYWFTARVLNLPADVAIQTTEFLKESGGRLDGIEAGVEEVQADKAVVMVTTGPSLDIVSETTTESDLGLRLERLEAQYRLLLEERPSAAMLATPSSSSSSSLRLSGYASDEEAFSIPRELPAPVPLSDDATASSMMQLIKVDDNDELVRFSAATATSKMHTAAAAATTLASQGGPFEASSTPQLQEIGLRLGRILLEWAGDTMKQSIITAAAKSTANQAVVGAGVDLAGRLVDAIVT